MPAGFSDLGFSDLGFSDLNCVDENWSLNPAGTVHDFFAYLC